ncbi:MAG TPA: glycoside hydrolase [Chitinispirillaceae bacterium]|nr:glycoside hydrolase [Chitinispirillaceae bacterium]
MQIGKKSVLFCAIFSLLLANRITEGVTVTVDAKVQYQEFEGWGTSICWWGNIVGKYPQQSRDSIIDLLFDTTNGLGLSIVRYNIGGGDNPSHTHMGTGKLMDGFKASATAQYDWTKDAGQRWCLEAAAKRIPSEWFISEAFSNSPPYWMTNSGCASGNSGGSNNLKTDYFDDFADYLTEVVKKFRDDWAVTFRTLEPMNEPMVGWSVNGGQEGCHIDVSLQDDLIREVEAKLDAKGLTGTKISAPDETNIDQTLASWNSYDATTKSYVFQVNTHVYGGSKRAELYSAVGGRKMWDSECDGSGAAAPFDQWTHNHNDIVPGLDIANRAIKDLREMKINAWIFWQAIESEQAQISLNKNWGLLHADFTGGNKYYITKKYYAVKQFSNFIRPFSKMIDINNNDAVAFLSPNQNKLIIVQRNASTSTVSYDYKLSNFKQISPVASVWRSSATENCKKVSDVSVANGTISTTSPAQSITTYVIQLDQTSALSNKKVINQSFIRCTSGNISINFVSPGNHALLKVYNLNGTLLKTIALKARTSSIFSSNYNVSDLPNGNYFVIICSGKQTLETSKIILTK